MTYRAEPVRPHLAVVGSCGPLMHRVAKGWQVRVLDDGRPLFAIVADEPGDAELVAWRMVELLNDRGLADVPDTPEAVADE